MQVQPSAHTAVGWVSSLPLSNLISSFPNQIDVLLMHVLIEVPASRKERKERKMKLKKECKKRERERELRKEGREVPSRVRLREGPIGVRITLGQPTIRNVRKK